MGDLKLLKTSNANGAYDTVWSISGNQGQSWRRNFIEIKSTVPFKVNYLFKSMNFQNL